MLVKGCKMATYYFYVMHRLMVQCINTSLSLDVLNVNPGSN